MPTQHILVGNTQRGTTGEDIGFGFDDCHLGIGLPHREGQLAARQSATDDDNFPTQGVAVE